MPHFECGPHKENDHWLLVDKEPNTADTWVPHLDWRCNSEAFFKKKILGLFLLASRCCISSSLWQTEQFSLHLWEQQNHYQLLKETVQNWFKKKKKGWLCVGYHPRLCKDDNCCTNWKKKSMARMSSLQLLFWNNGVSSVRGFISWKSSLSTTWALLWFSVMTVCFLLYSSFFFCVLFFFFFWLISVIYFLSRGY